MFDDREDLRKAIKELWYWQYGTDPTNFTSVLYTLISKADGMNKARLRSAYPDECQAFAMWEHAPDAKAFFREWISDRIKI